MRPVPPNLAKLRARRSSPRRYPVEAHIITRAAIKQTKADWQAGDGPPSSADFDFRADGGLSITPTIANLISSTSGASFFTDLNNDFPYSDALVSWGGTDDPNVEIQRVIANLHPNRDGSGRTVVWWKCSLFNVSHLAEPGPFSTAIQLLLTPVADLMVRAIGDAAGDVTFDFSTLASKPKLKMIRPGWDLANATLNALIAVDFPWYAHPCTIVRISAHKEDGSAATNVGWGYDNSITTFGTGNVLRGATLQDVYNLGPLVVRARPGWVFDAGSIGVPKLSIQTGSYTQKTITFSSGNLLDLGAAPVGPVILGALAETPSGSSVTFRIRNDADSAYVDYTDGQAFTDLALTATQTRKLQIVLTPNAAGSVAPVVRRAGMEEKTIKDLSHVAHIVRYNQHVDPVTLDGRITTATLRAIKNGRPDFRSTIEDLLSQNDLANIEIRWYEGGTRLAKKDWMLIDAFEIEDWEPEAAGVGVLLLGANAKMQARLPKYDLAGAGTEIPDSTVSNADGWTDQGGGSTNIHLTLDEDPADDTDFIRSPTSPSNDMIEIGLSNLADPGRDTGHFVDLRFRKDATGGENLTLVVDLRQGATQKMVTAALPVPDEWTDLSVALSLAQAQSISDYTDLRIRLTANVASGAGARRVQVSWGPRLRVEGQTPDLVYTNQTATAVYADLLSQAEVPGRLKGQGLTETETVSKTITDANALDELRALVSNFGKAVIGTRGVLQVVDMYSAGGAVRHFPATRIKPGRMLPGYRERRPRVFVDWNYSNEKNRFEDRVTWQNTTAITKLGHSKTDALDQRWDQEAGKYVYSRTTAQAIARRLGQAIGAGLILWPFTSLDAASEIECGDRVSLGTNRFLGRDPNAGRALRGNLAALATVFDVTYENGFWEIGGWVQGYHDIFGTPKDDTPLPKPSIRDGAPAWRGDHLFVGWTGDSKTNSVKIATSTTSQPAAGSGTAADGQSGELDTGAFTYTPLVFITITPYTGLAASGIQGEAFFTTFRLPFIHGMFDFTTGKPKRGQDYTDGKYALIAATNTGVLADPTVQLDPENGIKEGGVVYKLYRHREEITVNGGDADGVVAVTFTQVYQNIPMIFFRGGQYLSYSTTLGSGVNQRQRFQAQDVTTSGFTAIMQIVNTGATTARTADFASGNLIDAAGETAEVDLGANVPANDNTYNVHYYVEVVLSAPGVDPNVTLTVAIETNDGGGGGWIERATFAYSRSSAGTSTWTEEIKPIVVSGLGANDDIRLRAKSFVVHDATGSFKVRGGDAGGSNPESYNGVTWTTATDDADSAIPNAGDQVTWVAQEVA